MAFHDNVFSADEPGLFDNIRERELPYCSLYDEGFHRLGCVGGGIHSRWGLLVEERPEPGPAAASVGTVGWGGGLELR